MSDKLSDALAKFNTTMDHLGGCTDGGCVIKRPAGMHTNGGCRCPQDKMKMQRAMYAANGLRDAVAAALAASPAPTIPAEVVAPFGWVHPRGGNYFTRSEVAAKRIGGLMPVYASPPASVAPAISESEDTKRLDFMIEQQAWIQWTVRDGSIRQCQVYIQDEDENYHILSGENRYFNTPREAIDAARKGEKS